MQKMGYYNMIQEVMFKPCLNQKNKPDSLLL